MNSQHIPFVDLDAEMVALQERSEFYQAKVAALKLNAKEPEQIHEMKQLQKLDNECQSAIAFCFSRKMPRIK